MATLTRTVRAVPQRSSKRDLKRLAGRETPDAPEAATQIAAPELQAENPIEKLPTTIQNGRIAVNYLKPHFEHDSKTDTRTVGLELSLELLSQHENHIPKEILTWWEAIKGGGVKSMSLLGIPLQYVELGIAPEGDDRDLEIKAAPIQKAALAVIESTGSGEAFETIRLTFRVVCDLDSEIEKFACRNFGKTLWLKLQAVQGNLL